jgi:hypothetical protein
MTRIVLGLFSDQQDAAEVLQEVRRKKYRRSASVHKSQEGRVSIDQNGLSRTQSAILAGSIFLVVGIVTGLPAHYLILASLVGILAGGLSRRWLALGLDRKLLARYARWVLSDETLILVEVPAREMTRVVTVLRNRDSRPATFVVRPGQPFEQQLLEEPQRREPLTTERLKLLAVRLASGHRTAPPSGRPHLLLSQLRENESVINDVRLDLA